MQKFSTTFIGISICFLGICQPETAFQTVKINDTPITLTDAVIADDGTLLITGHTEKSSYVTNKLAPYGGQDVWLVKLKSDFTIDWKESYGGSSDETYPNLEKFKSGYLLACTSQSDDSGNKTEEGYGDSDFWILNLDSTGNILWQYDVGTAYKQMNARVELLNGQRIILTGFSFGREGYTSNGSLGSGQLFIELNEEGEILNEFVSETDGYLNDIYSDDNMLTALYVNQITQMGENRTNPTSEYHYYISVIDGDFTETIVLELAYPSDQIPDLKYYDVHRLLVTPDYYYLAINDYSIKSDLRLIKFDKKGNKIWDKTFGGSGHDILSAALITQEGNIILGAHSNSPRSGHRSESQRNTSLFDFWLISIDPSGEKIWDKTIPPAGSNLYLDRCLMEIKPGSYFCTGIDESGLAIARINYKRI